MPESVLELRHIDKRFGQTVTARDFSLSIERGSFFTLLGPSGSGKSTILRMIAGLDQPDSGQILIDREDVTDTPPWRRQLGMVFQQYANFPHMNVARNVGYGLRRSGLDQAQIKVRVSELLRLVSMEGFESRPIQQLSGGEQQRVAIARALAPYPQILLLDEPLSALDEKIRREMQLELRAIQQRTGTTFVYVTHDQEEALTMSDRVAVLNRGECVQCDEPEQIFRFPRTPFIAHFFRGANVVRGRLVTTSAGVGLLMPGVADPVPLAAPPPPGGEETVDVAIRAETITLGADAWNRVVSFEADLEKIIFRGLYREYILRLEDGQTLTATLTSHPDVSEGSKVRAGTGVEDLVLLEKD